MSVDWNSILNKKPEEAEKPKPTPAGNYIAIILKHEFKEANNEKKTPYVQYTLKLVSPQPDVDQAALQEAGGMEKISARTVTLDQYMTEDSMWRHREFLEKTCKINFGGRSWQPVIAETTNKQIMVHMAQSVSKKDGQTIYSNVDDTGPV